MAEREDFVAWLEKLDPPIPTTHDVEVAWRAWQARANEIERLREANEELIRGMTEMATRFTAAMDAAVPAQS